MADTPTVQADQIADAIVAVPGMFVEMMDKVPTGTRTTVSATFVDVDAEISQTFTAPVAGLYDVMLSISGFFATTAGAHCRFRMVYDGSINVGNDDQSWDMTPGAANSRREAAWRSSVELTAGSHTVKIQWKRTLLTGTCTVDGNSGFAVTGSLESGSGAGGALIDRQENATDVGSIGATPVVINTHTIQSSGETVRLTASWTATHTVVSRQRMHYRIDGGSWVQFAGQSAALASFPTGIAASTRVVLTAGSRTVDIGASVDSGLLTVEGAAEMAAFSEIWQLRGGQVPIEEAGTAKLATPIAVNYTRLTSVVDNAGKGDITPTLFEVVAEAAAGPRALTVAESGKTFSNEGAAAVEVGFTLPTAVASLTYSFIVQDIDGIRVTAAAGDTIRIAASESAAAGNIAATAIGTTVHLVAINATEWVALSSELTWTVT